MDHNQQLSQLDPKLQETYKRIMTNSNAINASAIGSTDTSPLPPSNNSNSSETPAQTIVANASTNNDSPSDNPIPQSYTTFVHNPKFQSTHSIPKQTGISKQKQVKIPTAMYIFGGFVFFVLYTLFWVKVFNISIPFLP